MDKDGNQTKNPSTLQTSRHDYVRHACFRCLNIFNSKESLASHHEYCKSYEAIKIELPEEGSKISVKNHNWSMRPIYCMC